MNWSEYKELSEKTLSTQFHCDKKEELLLHAIIGVITELEELSGWGEDEIGKKEEIADSFWYMAILDRELNLNFQILPGEDFADNNGFDNDKIVLEAYRYSSKLLDFLKKKLYYNKPINIEKFSEISNELFLILSIFCKINKIDVSDILDTNISKLKSRYGDKFSSERAINRDIEKERSILENN